jgi:cell division protein FtsB
MAARKKRTPVISLTQFVAIVTATLALTLLLGFAYKMNTNAQIRLEAEHLQERLEFTQAENEALRAHKTAVQSDAYVEKIAREELKWSRYGDKLVSIQRMPVPTPFPTLTAQSTPSSEPAVPQWDAWLDVFFGTILPGYGL